MAQLSQAALEHVHCELAPGRFRSHIPGDVKRHAMPCCHLWHRPNTLQTHGRNHDSEWYDDKLALMPTQP